MSKEELLARVCRLVQEVTEARFEGALHAKLARAHGYADGYMRALIDAELLDRRELLAAVSETRRAVIADDDSARAA